jgi:hypothetical protein
MVWHFLFCVVIYVVLMGTNVRNFDFAVGEPEFLPNFHILCGQYSTDGVFFVSSS